MIERLSGVLDVSYDGNLRPNRHGDGHRAHAHIRLTNPGLTSGRRRVLAAVTALPGPSTSGPHLIHHRPAR